VVLKLRYADFDTLLRQRALAEFTDDESVVLGVARRLMRENRDGRPVRLLGVSVAGLQQPKGVEQSAIFESDRRRRSLTRRVDGIRDRYGERAVLRAAALR
jgi:DNA polymerase-4